MNESFEKLFLFFKKKKFFLWIYIKVGYNGYSVFVREEKDFCLFSLVLSVGLGDDVCLYIFFCWVIFCKVEIFFFDYFYESLFVSVGGSEGGWDDDVLLVFVMLSCVLIVFEMFECVRKWRDEFWKWENVFR